MGVDKSRALSAEQAAEHCHGFHSVNSANLRVPILNPHGSGFQDNTQNSIAGQMETLPHSDCLKLWTN